VQTAVETLNQGSVALAVLKSNFVTNVKTGVTTSIFHAIDDNNELKDEWKSTEFKDVRGEYLLARIVATKILPVTKKSHGDYSDPLLIENSEWGRLGIMFKKFIPPMIIDRLGERRYDYKEQREIMGRYIALYEASKKTLSGRRSDIDATEMEGVRGSITEMIIAITLVAFAAAMRKGLCDTNECKNQMGITILGLNYVSDMAADAMMFIWSDSLYNTIVSPFAVEGFLTDFGRTVDSFTAMTIPGGDTGLYKQDTDFYEKGTPKFYKHAKRLVPFYRTNWVRYESLTNKLNYSPALSGIYSEDGD
jgi:hypothetical protein